MKIEYAQQAIEEWDQDVFTSAELRDGAERSLRHVEEAVELAQACGVKPEQIHRLVDYVFARPAGEPGQEIAGSLVTLLTAANVLDVDVATVFTIELERIRQPGVIARIRRRQTEKREVTG